MDEEELQKHTLNLYAGDYDRLAVLFPDLKTAVVIRRIVRKHIELLEESVEQGAAPNIGVNL